MKYYPAFYKCFKSLCQVLDQSFRFYLEHAYYEMFSFSQVKKKCKVHLEIDWIELLEI